MATNRDLLKEAIADAKAVKETAIANAKAALEEAFTPFLKEKLASKIAEMEEEDVNEVKAEDEEMKVDEAKMEDEAMEVDEISLDELLAELELEEGGDEDLPPAPKDTDPFAVHEGEEEEISIEDMTEDDLKAFVEDVIKDMVASGELEAGHEGGEEEEAGEEGGEEEGGEAEVDMEAGAEEVDEEINIDELLSEMETEKETEMKEGQVDEYIEAATMPEAIAGLATALGVPIAIILSVLKDSKKKAKLAKDVKDIAANKEATSEELAEAYSTIETLRNELNEINLLNAKLLYTNKIFRNKSLTETQKVHVLTAFDKATTKKEVELVYETLMESTKATKAPIKESMGSASKSIGGATTKPIIENDAFARMRELAFGNKK